MKQYWVIRDRRQTKEEVFASIVNGHYCAIYFQYEAAKVDAYQTEKVWKVSVNIKEEDK